jgi:hypothetical protein
MLDFRNIITIRRGLRALCTLLLIATATVSLSARDKKDKLPYGEGLIVNIPLPENEVEQVVADVAQNGIIRGTKEYNKDEFVSGANAASSSSVFPSWTEGGKVFYKVREHALDPRNFKDSGDVGALVVRFVVLPQGDKNTVLRIDALFQEDFRRTVHQSSGSVESAEYKDIQEHLEAIEVMKKQNAESEAERQEQILKKQNRPIQSGAFPVPLEGSDGQSSSSKGVPAEPVRQEQEQNSPGAGANQISSSPSPSRQSPSDQSAAESAPGRLTLDQNSEGQPPAQAIPSVPGPILPGQTLEDHVKELRKQVERLVKAPGAPLKSAPFHTASTLQSLTPGTEVLILISTPYWYGVETHDGQHGWMQRDELEQP